jgi:hypothetical protein
MLKLVAICLALDFKLESMSWRLCISLSVLHKSKEINFKRKCLMVRKKKQSKCLDIKVWNSLSRNNIFHCYTNPSHNEFSLNLNVQNMYLVKWCPHRPSNLQNKGNQWTIFSFVSRKPFTSTTSKLLFSSNILWAVRISAPAGSQEHKFWPCPCNLAGLQCWCISWRVAQEVPHIL